MKEYNDNQNAEAREKLIETLSDDLLKLYTTSPERFAAAIEFADSILKGGEDA